jgi:hypothetical protein
VDLSGKREEPAAPAKAFNDDLVGLVRCTTAQWDFHMAVRVCIDVLRDVPWASAVGPGPSQIANDVGPAHAHASGAFPCSLPPLAA